MIDLKEIFKDFPEHAIMRMSDTFPAYKKNSDVDVLCANLDDCIEHLNDLLPLKRINKTKDHVQLDYIVDGKLDIKFDLYGLYISEKFTREALSEKTSLRRFYKLKELHDGISKYYEYAMYNKEKYSDYKPYKSYIRKYAV